MTGEVRLKLYKGSVRVTGRRSPVSLYSEATVDLRGRRRGRHLPPGRRHGLHPPAGPAAAAAGALEQGSVVRAEGSARYSAPGSGGRRRGIALGEEAEQPGDRELHQVHLGRQLHAEGEQVRERARVEQQIVRELEPRGVLRGAPSPRPSARAPGRRRGRGAPRPRRAAARTCGRGRRAPPGAAPGAIMPRRSMPARNASRSLRSSAKIAWRISRRSAGSRRRERPKSTNSTRGPRAPPCSRTNRFPGCGSAWNRPSTNTCRA